MGEAIPLASGRVAGDLDRLVAAGQGPAAAAGAGRAAGRCWNNCGARRRAGVAGRTGRRRGSASQVGLPKARAGRAAGRLDRHTERGLPGRYDGSLLLVRGCQGAVDGPVAPWRLGRGTRPDRRPSVDGVRRDPVAGPGGRTAGGRGAEPYIAKVHAHMAQAWQEAVMNQPGAVPGWRSAACGWGNASGAKACRLCGAAAGAVVGATSHEHRSAPPGARGPPRSRQPAHTA